MSEAVGSVAAVAAALARLLPVLGLRATGALPEALRETPGQLLLLHLLEVRPGAAIGELARQAGVTMATMSAMVRRLVEKGLAGRAQDPQDWRTVRVTLTPAGRELLQAVAAQREQALAALLAGARPGEAAVLAEAVGILGRLLRGRD